MNSRFKNIGLIGVHRNPRVAQTLLHCLALLDSWRIHVVVETDSAKTLDGKTNTQSLKEIGQHCDLVIAIGGDGNLLSAARYLSQCDVPVLGINRGQLGFLTDIKPDNLEQDLADVLTGNYQEETRFLLAAQACRAGEVIGSGNALNDVVLFPGQVAQLMEFTLEIDDQFVYTQRSDGLIISTPTGSTAYALSAGGPIISPQLEALLLVPMLPHTLTNRPIVLDAHSKVTITIADFNRINPRVSFDGQHHIDLTTDDQLIIQRQKPLLRLIHPTSHDFYQVLRSKLHWGKQFIPLERTTAKC